MRITKFIADLLHRGVQVGTDGEQLTVRAPANVLTPDERAILSQEKAAILALLRQYADGALSLYPLSHGQRALWFVQQLAPESATHHITCALHIRDLDEADEAALPTALQTLVDRHQILRTHFPVIDGEPIQVVHNTWPIQLETTDAYGWREAALNTALAEEADRPFDLMRESGLRARIFRLAETEAVLQLTVHHITIDFWSLEILLDEFTQLYDAIRRGGQPSLPPPQQQYQDYVRWQTEMLAGPRGAQLRDYWQQQLAGEAPVLSLPADHPRPPVQSYTGCSTRGTILDAKLASDLRTLARAESTTLYTLIFAAFQVLLFRLTGQTDIRVGSPMSSRTQPEFRDVVGYLANPIVVRGDLAENPTFKAFLKQLGQSVLGALEHIEYPFPLLVEQLQPERDPSRSPLYQVGLAWDKARLPSATPQDATSGQGLEIILWEQRGAQVDLVLTVYEQGPSLAISWRYCTDLFEPETIARMQEHFLTLLSGIVADPAQPVAQLPLLSAPERQRILVDWNETAAEFPNHHCFHHLFEAQVERTPDALALIFQDQRLTYQELNRRANQLAHHLQALGVKPGVLVGVCVERSPDMIVAILAALKAGGAYVPLDPAYPRDRLAFMLADSQLRVLLTQAPLLEKLPDHGAKVVLLEQDWPHIAQARTANPASPVTAADPAYVIYTSGSTGTPKGTLVGHRGLCNTSQAQVQLFGLGPGDRVLQFSSLSFDASTFEICMALRTGATLCLGTRDSLLPGTPLLRFLQELGITICTLTPSTLAAVPWADLPALHTITVAGEACSAELVARWATGRRFFNLYGPTEATIWSTYAECSAGSGRPPIGRPILNTRVYVLDPHLQPVPIGVAGELYIGGEGLAHGYLHRPELTQERFIPNLFSADPTARLYKTGDLVRYLPDGQLDYLGRIDHQVKLRGFRIELGEIETVFDQHPHVQEAVVLIHEEEPDDRRLVAYVVPQADAPPPTAQQLRHFLKDKLPEYMLPSVFVFLERIPVNANGKTDRQALARAYTAQVTADQRAPDEHFVPPKTNLEQVITSVWQEVLKIEKVGLYDNFFDLGGHSLLLMQVHSALQERLGWELTVTDLFQYATVAALAEHLQHNQNGHTPQDQVSRSGTGAASEEPEAIAIVGLAGRFPKAATLEQFWQNLCDGVEAVTFFTDEELEAAGVDPALLAQPHYVKANCILEEPDLFDAAFFGFNPREAALLDPQHRIFLECAQHALDQAGIDPDRFPGAIGVYAGSTANTYYAANIAPALAQTDTANRYQTALGNDKDFLTTRVSYKLNLQGPSIAIQTACSTSLVAVHMAYQALLTHQCDAALAGGVSITFPQHTGYLYQDGMILSPDGHCRAFDAQAQGTIVGQGAALVVLKRLSDALAAGDTIHALIKGSAVNNDGSGKVGYTAPSITGQTQVIAQAHAQADIDPMTVSYIEAHGTGTPLGDPAEVAALTQAYATDQRHICALGSVKSNLGHLDAAAGIAGLVKTVLALEYQLIPPSLHYSEPNPQIDFERSPFYVNSSLRPWESNGTPRRAGVSSFGIGGTNAHVILEEAPPVASGPSKRPWQLLLLSAKSARALDMATQNLADHLQQTPDANLADVAFTLQVGRSVYPHRRVAICCAVEDAVETLAAQLPSRVFSAVQENKKRPVAFMFPGQGAQYVQMGRELYDVEPVFRAAVDACAAILEPQLGIDLRHILYPEADGEADAQAQLRQTAITQPALFIIEYALAQLWMHWDVQPQAMIGHSIGEYVAATLAGVLTLEDALHLVALRGRMIQQLPAGAMLAVSLTEPELQRYLDARLSLAVVNASDRCVVAGPTEAVADLQKQLAAQGVSCQRLETSHAFHSAMMDPILASFADQVGRMALHAPQIPFISNLTGDWITPAEATDPAYWVNHLRHTVRFDDGLAELLKNPELVLLEVGPGQTLSRLARRHSDRDSRQVAQASMRGARERTSDEATLMTALGQLWLAGVDIRWEALYDDEQRKRVPLPAYPFERQRYWIEPSTQTAPAAPSTAKRPDIASWFYIPSWTRMQARWLPDTDLLDMPQRRWLVFLDDYGIGAQIVARLRQAGHPVTTVSQDAEFARLPEGGYTVQPDSPSHYQRLVAALHQDQAMPDQIVHLWSLAKPDERVHPPAWQEQTQGFYSLLYLAQALANHTPEQQMQIHVVSSGSQTVTGQEAIDPNQATVLGLSRVIPQEYPHIRCRNVDIELPESGACAAERLAGQLMAEVMMDRSDPVIAYRGPFRWKQAFEPARLDEQPAPPSLLREQGVYLITGGLGDVGLELAAYLAQTVRAKLVLLGRTPLPDRAEWHQWLTRNGDQHPLPEKLRRIRAIEARGAEVLTLSADVGHEEQMHTAIAAALARFGQIDGVIHAAGTTTMHLLDETTHVACQAHFHPKVQGLIVLEKVLRGLSLDFCLLTSSLSTLAGGLGLGAYAAANSFMDAFAQRQNQAGDVPWICVNWDGWLFQAEDGESGRSARQRVDTAMTPEEGVTTFARILSMRAGPQVIVSTSDLQARLARWVQTPPQATPPHQSTPSIHQARPNLATDYIAPRDELEEQIAATWQDLLGIARIGVHDNFFDLGGDSLLGIQAVTRLRQRLAVDLSVQDLFEAPAVAQLADVLKTTRLAAQTLPVTESDTGEREEIEL